MELLFILLCALFIFLVSVMIFYRPILNEILRKNCVEFFGKKIYKLSVSRDLMLINDFTNNMSENSSVHIDHLLFGEKYIYVINDRFYNGSLKISENSNSWVYYYKSKKKYYKEYIENPILENISTVSKISSLTNMDVSLFKSIVLINDSCDIGNFTLTNDTHVISLLSDLPKKIKKFESEKNISDIDQISLERAVKDIANLNERTKK